jgi:hypothetical protein
LFYFSDYGQHGLLHLYLSLQQRVHPDSNFKKAQATVTSLSTTAINFITAAAVPTNVSVIVVPAKAIFTIPQIVIVSVPINTIHTTAASHFADDFTVAHVIAPATATDVAAYTATAAATNLIAVVIVAVTTHTTTAAAATNFIAAIIVACAPF